MSNKVTFHSEEIEFDLSDSEKHAFWIEQIINDKKKIVGDISYVFCDDEYLLNINKQYLDHDYYTDIITFDYCEKEIISGDIFVSIDRIKENAELHNSTFENELLRVMSHGVLHLLGLKDKTKEESEEMRRKENECIEQFSR